MEHDKRNLRKSLYGDEVEFFDGNNWKKISDYKKDDKVLTFFLKDKHVELLKPIKFIRIPKDKSMMNLRVKCLDFSLNKDAIFVGDYRDGSEITTKTIFTLERVMESNFIMFSHHNMYNAFSYDSKCSSMMTEDRLRVMILSLMLGKTNDNNECTVKIKNNNIKTHLKRCLDRGGIKCKVGKTKEGYVMKYILPRGKKIFIENPLTLSQQEIHILIDEIEYITDKKSMITPVDKDSYDFIQMIYALDGKKVIIKEDYLLRYNWGTTLTERKANVEISKKKIQYSFTTKSGYIVLRNNGMIFIMGDYKK